MATNAWTAWTGLLNSSLRLAQTGITLRETITASREVIDSRCRTIAEAAIDPLSADYRELGRMVPEKVDAFGRATTNAFGDFIAIQSAALANYQQIAEIAFRGRAPTPVEAEAIWSRSCGMVELAMGSTGRALAPLHKRVTANARRLRGKAA